VDPGVSRSRFRGICRVILAAAALLVAIAVRPVWADDRSVCVDRTVDEAIAACSRLLAVNPKDALAYAGRAIAYNHKGDCDRAISDLDQAIRLDRKFPKAYTIRGEAYEAKNDPDHAIADFDQALKVDPSQSVTHVSGTKRNPCLRPLKIT
jgi:tetratricopeptide (TPR) repeat protein